MASPYPSQVEAARVPIETAGIAGPFVAGSRETPGDVGKHRESWTKETDFKEGSVLGRHLMVRSPI